MLGRIGRGGFACVYRARSVKTGEEVAIKMIDKKLMKSTNMIDRVTREVEIHSRLVKSNIAWNHAGDCGNFCQTHLCCLAIKLDCLIFCTLD